MKPSEIQQAFDALNSKYLLVLQRLQAAYTSLDSMPNVAQLKNDNAELKKKLIELQKKLDEKPTVIEKIVEIEKEVPVEVERAATKDLREAARLMSKSSLNKEDLSEEEIYSILQKSSDDDIKRKLGFWAVPLPKKDSSPADAEVSKRYIGKK